MRNTAIYNVVFNRKNSAGDESLIQVEILFCNKRKKYVGVTRIKKSEWDPDRREVINTPLAGRLNNEIQDVIRSIRNYELKQIELGYYLTPEDVDNLLKGSLNTNKSFVQFMRNEINKRRDISPMVRSHQLHVVTTLEKLGIINFSDLNYENIRRFDQFWTDKHRTRVTIHKKHQEIITYIHIAEKLGLMSPVDNPYNVFKNKKGKSKIRVRLDDSEIEKIRSTEIIPDHLRFARDIYVFQMFTGLSYTDVRALTYSENISYQDNGAWITGRRRKDDVPYSIPLVAEALEIMERYKDDKRDQVFKTNILITQNMNLVLVASLCGIKKHITSHTARHTAATMMLRKGVPIEYISAVLGHTSIATTQIYSKIEKEGLRNYMERISGK